MNILQKPVIIPMPEKYKDFKKIPLRQSFGEEKETPEEEAERIKAETAQEDEYRQEELERKEQERLGIH